jgi:hypothetical protein
VRSGRDPQSSSRLNLRLDSSLNLRLDTRSRLNLGSDTHSQQPSRNWVVCEKKIEREREREKRRERVYCNQMDD